MSVPKANKLKFNLSQYKQVFEYFYRFKATLIGYKSGKFNLRIEYTQA